ncbi:MAG: 3'-5' exonuclease [Clostridia bacterium]|nr:3'-5' exonuclease [Clostridia bacterium]
MDFTAIDFETANYKKTSACSIGITTVENGRIAGTEHHLIRPYPDYFTASNIDVHGIRAADVADAPTFDELWPQIRHHFDGRIVAAHWASFDMGVLTSVLDHYGLPYPEMDIICSCLMARSAFPQLANHKLNNVCTYLDIPLQHHRADSDSAGSAAIILDVLKRRGIETLDDIKRKLGVMPGSMHGGKYISAKGPRGRRKRQV